MQKYQNTNTPKYKRNSILGVPIENQCVDGGGLLYDSCILEFLQFVLFVFCSICILLHLYFVTFVFLQFVFCSFVFCRVCILEFCHVCILFCLHFGVVFCSVCVMEHLYFVTDSFSWVTRVDPIRMILLDRFRLGLGVSEVSID